MYIPTSQSHLFRKVRATTPAQTEPPFRLKSHQVNRRGVQAAVWLVLRAAVWAANAAVRASLTAISPCTQARPASTAFRGWLSFWYFSSKYESTCSVQSVAQITNVLCIQKYSYLNHPAEPTYDIEQLLKARNHMSCIAHFIASKEFQYTGNDPRERLTKNPCISVLQKASAKAPPPPLKQGSLRLINPLLTAYHILADLP